MFCLAKHKGEGLLPFYRIIYRIAALRGVALAIGEVARSDGGVENAIVSVFILDIPFSSLTCPIALRKTVLAI